MADKKPVLLNANGTLEQMQSGDTVPLANGGTGAVTSLAARINLGTYDGVLTSDYTNATQSHTALSLGTFTIGANETWSFEVCGVGQVSGASGVRFKVAYSNAPVTASQIQTQATTAGGLTAQTDGVTIATTPAENSTVWAAATTEVPFSIKGCVVNTGSSCTITINCRCIGSSQTVTIRQGTYITARRIS